MSDLEAVISAAIAPASAAAAAAETPEPVAETPVAETPETPKAEPVAEAEEVTPPAETAVAEGEKPAETPKPVEPVDEFAAEHGIKAKDSSGRENRIPYSAVKRINANAVAKATTALTATHTAALAERAAVTSELEGRLTKVAEVERMMFEDQPRFLAILKTLPGYAELLAAQPPVVAPLTGKPGPDTDTGYSPEGLDALLAWTTEQAVVKATAAAEERIAKRYKPIEDRHKQEQADVEFNAQATPKIAAMLKDARDNWPGYTTNEAEIQQAYLADKSLTLEAAWRKVMIPKLSADRAKMRTELIAEIAAAPNGTGITPGAAPTTTTRVAPVVDPNKPMDLEDVIRASIHKK